MPTVRPFRALRYDPAKVGDLSLVVTQPYDKITPQMQEAYYARHPNNAVRLVLAKGDRYRAAREALRAWLESGVLIEDPAPAFYLYAQEYVTPWGERRVRRGITAMVLAEEFGRGRVFPHEATHDKPKEDRFRLLSEARAHFGHVFLIYGDRKRVLGPIMDVAMARPPDWEARDDTGDRHRVWRIDAPADVRTIARELERHDAVVADGHHRYETAVAYRNAQGRGRGDRPHDYVLATLVNWEEPGLTVLPTHRTIYGVEGFDPRALAESVARLFEVRPYGADAASWREFLEDLRFEGTGRTALGMVIADGGPRLLVDTRGIGAGRLDVEVLHREILERMLGITPEDTKAERYVRYVRDPNEAAGAVRSGDAQAAFFVNPVPVARVAEMARAGRRLPQKTTDFYPKMLSGLIMARLDGWMG